MAGELKRVSRNALDHTVTFWRQLLQVSIVPFVLIVAAGTLYLAAIDLDSFFVPAEDATVNLGQLLGNFALSAINLALWSWLVVKVLRLRLVDEDISLIGSPGTLRCSGRMLAYSLGALGLAFGGLLAVSIVGTTIIVALNIAALFYLVAFLGLFIIGWGLSRLYVGFVPIALGERPNFFSGFALTQETHMALFARVMSVLAIVLIILALDIFILFIVFGDSIVEFVEAVEAGTASPSLSIIVLFNLASQAVTLLCYWFYVSFFAEAYLRLSGRTPPLPAV